MIIKNLKIGMIIKNYKELCNILGIEVTNGNSKKKQFKELERFIKYHKSGNKFIIDEIYDKPKPKIKIKGNNSKYIDEIQDILTYYIYKENKKSDKVILSISKIINILGLCNNTYSVANFKKRELSELLHIDLTAIYYFFNTSRTEFKGIIERSLHNLEMQRVLVANKTFVVGKIDKKEKNVRARGVTKDEFRLILDTENMVLGDMGLKTLKDLFLKGIKVYKEFTELVNKELPKEWDFYYPAWDLIIGDNAIKREYTRVLTKKKQLNSKSIERLEHIFKTKSDKNSIEQKLINQLISFEGYNSQIDEALNQLYTKNQEKYYKSIKEEGAKIVEASIKIDKLQDDYKNKDVIELNDYMKYRNKIKNKDKYKFPDEYWNGLFKEIDSLS